MKARVDLGSQGLRVRVLRVVRASGLGIGLTGHGLRVSGFGSLGFWANSLTLSPEPINRFYRGFYGFLQVLRAWGFPGSGPGFYVFMVDRVVVLLFQASF